jgi:PAS domain S-box-containing protein
MSLPIEERVPAGVDRGQIEAALRESEARLRSVVDSAQMILWAVDAEGVFTASEGGGLQRLGLAPADVVGRSAFEVYADVPQILTDTRRALAGEEFTSVVEAAGSVFESRYSVVRAASGAVQSVIGVAIDITERREAESALRRAERRAQRVADRLQAVAAAAAGVIGAESLEVLQSVLRDACRRVISFDAFTFARYDAASHTLSYLEGYDEDMLVPARTISAEGVPSERVIREQRSLVTLRAADPAAAGSIVMGTGRRSESIIRTPILGGDEVLGVIAVQSYTPELYTDDDVGVLEAIASLGATAMTNLRLRAERRAAEEALRISETRFRTMFEQFPLSVQIFDPSGRTLEVNRAWSALFGARLDDVRNFNPLHDPRLEGIRPLLERGFAGETLTTPPQPFDPHRAGGDGPAEGADGGGSRLLEATICPVKEPNGEIREVILVHQDVSERRRAEQSLRSSEASYRTIFELASDAIFVHDVRTGAILDANRRACELHGCTLEELKALGVPGISDGTPPYDAAHAREHIVRAAAGEPQLFEWRVRDRAGQRYWVEVTLHRVCILGEDRVLASVRNVTERKAAEVALHGARDELERRVEERTAELAETNLALEEEIGERERAEQELRQKTAEMEAVLRALPDLYLRLSAEGVILDYQAGQTSHGPATTTSWVGEHLLELLPPDVGPRFGAAFDEALVATEPICVEYALGGPEPREFEARLLPMAGPQIICVVRDITDRKQAELALQRSEEHFRALIENSSDIATIIDATGVSRYQSPSFERLLGYEPSERTGTRPFELMHPDDAAAAREALVRMMSDPGTTHEVEFRYRHKDGSWRFIEAVGRTLLSDSAAAGVIVNSRDVTARRQAEEALRDSEASYRGLFDNLAELVYIQDLEGRFLNVNEAVVRAYGYSREELLGRTPAMLADPERVQMEDTLARFRRAVAGEPQRSEWWGRRKDGSVFPKDLVLARSTYFGQDVVIGVARDITEQKRAEEALRRSEEHFRSLIENASDLITILDGQGTIRYESPAIERLLGYRVDELIDQNALAYVHPDDVQPTLEALSDVAAWPGTTRSAEFRFRHRDGSWRYLEALGRTLDTDSAEGGLVVNSRDITERKQAEEAFRLQKTLLEAQGEASIDGILFVADDRRMLSYNRRFVEMWGIPPEVVALKSDDAAIGAVLAKLQDPDAFLARVTYLYEHPQEESRDEILLRDGRVFDRCSAPVCSDGSYYGRIWFFRDMTERKRFEDMLRQAKEEAETANRAKSEFLSRMSHELRTPMNSILGFAQLLLKRGLTADQHKGVEHILKAGRHLLNLINEVLDIARIEAGRHQLSLEPVPVGGVLQEALSLIRPLAAQHACGLDELPPIEAGWHVRADYQRLTQVLLNLLSNAVKYNHPGGRVTISVAQPAGDEDRRDRLRIGVHDTGRGIPAERMSELFVPFARLGAEHTETEGTGLGLALSQRLVEAMDGELQVESTPGLGSTFWVELWLTEGPLARSDAERHATGRSDARPPSDRPATVLYVEDNLANFSLIESILAARPAIKLLLALQGQLGLDLAWEHRPDLILLDLHLPDMAGDEVLRRLLADPRSRATPVVLISADATSRRIDELLGAGAAAYLTKPLDVDVFLDTVDRLLATPREPASLP